MTPICICRQPALSQNICFTARQNHFNLTIFHFVGLSGQNACKACLAARIRNVYRHGFLIVIDNRYYILSLKAPDKGVLAICQKKFPVFPVG